jgi:hypothetical protein
MIISRILQHDFHKSKKENIWIPWIEFSDLPVPCLVSSTRGKFLVARKHHDNGIIKSGTFEYSSDQLDDHLNPLIQSALNLSISEKHSNRFNGKTAAKDAFDFMLEKHKFGQPYICLIPNAWTDVIKNKFFGKKNINESNKYNEYCKILTAPIEFPVFLTKPSDVGTYVQLIGDTHSIVVHNVKFGMAFCPGW